MAKPQRIDPKQEFAIRTVEEVQNGITPVMIADALKECLQATTTNREGTFPDFGTRLRAAQLIIETTIGRPIMRQEIIHKEIKSEEETWEAIKRSPAALAALKRKIEQAEAENKLTQELGPIQTPPPG